MAKRQPRGSQKEIELAKIHSRHVQIMAIIGGVRAILLVAAFAVPLWPIYGMVARLAGKETIADLSITVYVSVGITVTLTGLGAFFLARKLSKQKAELIKCRERIERLESRMRDIE